MTILEKSETAVASAAPSPPKEDSEEEVEVEKSVDKKDQVIPSGPSYVLFCFFLGVIYWMMSC